MRKGGRRSPDFGTPLPVLPIWIRAVNDELEKRANNNEHPGSRSELARALGHKVTPTAITQILSGQYKSSSLVEPISRLLNLPLPPPNVRNDEVAELAHIGARLYTENRTAFDALLQVARSYLGKK